MSIRKIVEISDLTQTCTHLREEGKTIIHCHGCFDFLHFGHLKHFKAAKKHGDILVVTLTADQYINKGPDRPFYKAEQRAEFIASLEVVDYVCINLWPTASETIGTLKPHKFVKGGEYRDTLAAQNAGFQKELAALESVDGEMVFTDEITFSSSRIIGELA